MNLYSFALNQINNGRYFLIKVFKCLYLHVGNCNVYKVQFISLTHFHVLNNVLAYLNTKKGLSIISYQPWYPCKWRKQEQDLARSVFCPTVMSESAKQITLLWLLYREVTTTCNHQLSRCLIQKNICSKEWPRYRKHHVFENRLTFELLRKVFNTLSPGVLDPGNYKGGVLRTHSYILPFLGFFMPPSINVKPHIE